MLKNQYSTQGKKSSHQKPQYSSLFIKKQVQEKTNFGFIQQEHSNDHKTHVIEQQRKYMTVNDQKNLLRVQNNHHQSNTLNRTDNRDYSLWKQIDTSKSILCNAFSDPAITNKEYASSSSSYFHKPDLNHVKSYYGDKDKLNKRNSNNYVSSYATDTLPHNYQGYNAHSKNFFDEPAIESLISRKQSGFLRSCYNTDSYEDYTETNMQSNEHRILNNVDCKEDDTLPLGKVDFPQNLHDNITLHKYSSRQYNNKRKNSPFVENFETYNKSMTNNATESLYSIDNQRQRMVFDKDNDFVDRVKCQLDNKTINQLNSRGLNVKKSDLRQVNLDKNTDTLIPHKVKTASKLSILIQMLSTFSSIQDLKPSNPIDEFDEDIAAYNVEDCHRFLTDIRMFILKKSDDNIKVVDLEAILKDFQKVFVRKTKNHIKTAKKGNVFDHLAEWKDIDPRDPKIIVEVYDKEDIKAMLVHIRNDGKCAIIDN